MRGLRSPWLCFWRYRGAWTAACDAHSTPGASRREILENGDCGRVPTLLGLLHQASGRQSKGPPAIPAAYIVFPLDAGQFKLAGLAFRRGVPSELMH